MPYYGTVETDRGLEQARPAEGQEIGNHHLGPFGADPQ